MGREARRLLIALAAALVPVAPAMPAEMAAEVAPGVGSSSELSAPLELVVNGAGKGTTVVLLRGRDVLVEAQAMERAGLAGLGGQREKIGRITYVSLRSIRELRWEVDDSALALRVSVPKEALGREVLDLRTSTRPPGFTVRSDASGFLNYALQLDTDRKLGASFEAGVTAGTGLLYSGLSRDLLGNWTRGLSYFTYDEPDRLRRWLAGDTLASGGVLGGSPLVGGLSITREFSLDPYMIHGPLPRTTALALTPSTLEVYVNGVLVRQERIPPGAYQLQNIPVQTGPGSIQTIVRDAFGRTQEVDSRYYYSSGLLAQGLSDYGYHFGFLREGFGAESFGYGEPVLLARHRLGLADWVTGGLRLEAARGEISGGPAFTIAAPAGELEVAVAASADGGRPGAASSIAYSYAGLRLSGGAYLRAQSVDYSNLSLRAGDDRPLVQASGFLGARVASRLSLQLELVASRFRDAGVTDSVTLGADLAVASGLSLLLRGSYGRDAFGVTAPSVFAMLTYAIQGQTTGTASMTRRADGTLGGAAGVQRSLPMGDGYGYRVEGAVGDTPATGTAQLQVQGAHGRAEVTYGRMGSAQVGTAAFAGGAVMIDRSVFFTRPVQEGYALIQVPGVDGVRGYLENQEIGRTDRRGNLLVPTLAPYHANRLSIAPTDVPLDRDLGVIEHLVGTPRRAGAVVRFDADPVQPVSGRVLIADLPEGASVPFAELMLLNGREELESPLDERGHFWFQRLAPGAYPARVEYRGGSCTAVLRVPDSSEPRIDLGEIGCKSTQAMKTQERRTIPTAPTSIPTPTPTATATPAPSATPTATPSAPPTSTATPIAIAKPPTKSKKVPRAKSSGSRDGFEALFCGPGKVWICQGRPSPGSGWPASRCCVPSSGVWHRLKPGTKRSDRRGREPLLFLLEPQRRPTWLDDP